jgi:hypothetical protein
MERRDTFVKCACVGQAVAVLSNYSDFLAIINRDGTNEKLIAYVRLLFLLHGIRVDRIITAHHHGEKRHRKMCEAIFGMTIGRAGERHDLAFVTGSTRVQP